MTKLQAVNIILSNVGQAPVTNLESANPIAQLATGVLAEVSGAVQSEGWSFNTEYEYPVTPDDNGHIVLPEDIISYDASPFERIDPIVREGKLYDRRGHTFVFEQKSYKFDVVWQIDFDSLPEPAKQYIVARAAGLYAARAVGAVDVSKYNEKEEAMARANLIQYECDQADPNVFQGPDGRHLTRGFQTFAPIYRY